MVAEEKLGLKITEDGHNLVVQVVSEDLKPFAHINYTPLEGAMLADIILRKLARLK